MAVSFQQELARWCPILPDLPNTVGPYNAPLDVSLHESEAYCRHLSRTHYENFPLVSWLLPKKLHQHFYNIYAYCRWADDLADEVADPEQSLRLLAWWRSQLEACYQGKTEHPVFVALRTTIDKFHIPSSPFEDLITAFEQDQQVSEYETFAELLNYCRYSANPVGRLVLFLCQRCNERSVAMSDSVCTGLQLANFWQDASRDLDLGRVYIPVEDCDRFGYSRDDLRRRVTNRAFLELMRFQVERTREYLDAVYPLADSLPGRLQVDIELFGRGGIKVLERIAGIQYRVWEHRPIVTKRDFAGLLMRSVGRLLLRRSGIWRSRSSAPSKATRRTEASS